MSCISHAGTVNHVGHSDRSKWDEYTGCVSESGNFATLLFSCFGNTGADAAIAILLPTLKRFICSGAVDWSTKCFFSVKVFYKNGDSFVIAQREFRREFGIHRNCAIPSARAIKTWVRNFEATSSTLKKKCGSVKTVGTLASDSPSDTE